MGKQSKPNENQNDQDHVQQQQNLDLENADESPRNSRRSCFSRLFSLRCLIVLVFSLAVLLSAIFWLFPRRSPSQFDAGVTAKRNATIQAFFKLNKPASEVISQKGRLEDDIFQSIGLSNTKVSVLSIHQSGVYGYTEVEFSVLPEPTGTKISQESLNSLRSTFVKLFVHRSKLNLTISSFGKATSFQVLKFPGGITVDPLVFRSTPFSGGLDIQLLNFTLDKSIFNTQMKLHQLKDKFEEELCLKQFERIHVLLTNEEGSTISPPITVKIFVTIFGKNPQQRLDDLAHIIQTFRDKNLGLDNSVFGEVESVTFLTDMEGKNLDDSAASVLAPAPSS